MLIMEEKGIRGGIWHAIHWYAKVDNKYEDKNKESSYFMYWNANMLYGWEMSQKLLLGSFKYVEEIFQFDEDFIKCDNEDSTIAYFLGFDIHYPGKLQDIHNDLPFQYKRIKIERVEKYVAKLRDKKNMLFI